jgi:hypothetical protein
MKRLIASLCLSTSFCIAQESSLKPLWEEESHFCYYRTLCIQGSVTSLGNLIEEAKENPENIDSILDSMKNEVENCKRALGY